MRPEDAFYKSLSSGWCRGGEVETTRIESWASNGTPDVFVACTNPRVQFWAELKVVHPKGTLLRFSQFIWMNKHWRLGVNCCTIARDIVQGKVYVFFPPYSPELEEVKISKTFYKVLNDPAIFMDERRNTNQRLLNKLFSYFAKRDGIEYPENGEHDD